MPVLIDMMGRRFGRWLVIGGPTRRKGSVLWLCRCDCGVEREVFRTVLSPGVSQSCGCLAKEKRLATNTKHGMCTRPEYEVWCAMKRRCNARPNSRAYAWYVARGITVCDRWRDSFELFFEDMGPRPSAKHSIDRIDNAGNYEPGNCRWATNLEQSINRRTTRFLTLNGETKSTPEWAIALGVSQGKLRTRIHAGHPVEVVLREAFQIKSADQLDDGRQ